MTTTTTSTAYRKSFTDPDPVKAIEQLLTTLATLDVPVSREDLETVQTDASSHDITEKLLASGITYLDLFNRLDTSQLLTFGAGVAGAISTEDPFLAAFVFTVLNALAVAVPVPGMPPTIEPTPGHGGYL